MDYLNAFEISAAGMTAERARVDVSALNIANSNTLQGADGVSYRPMKAVARSMPRALAGAPAFADQIDQVAADAATSATAAVSLPLVSVEPAGIPPRLVYEPGNLLADKKGFVAYAGVDTAAEMINMMGAVRSYEANVAAMNMAKTLALRALDIGGSSS